MTAARHNRAAFCLGHLPATANSFHKKLVFLVPPIRGFRVRAEPVLRKNYWKDEFDWKRQIEKISAFHDYRYTSRGVGIHFIHERGEGPAPIPLVLTGREG